MHRRFVLIAFLALGQAFILSAQDTRTVIEPFFPQLCTTLDAQLQASGHSLAPADEQKLDTARIQRAIDKCGSGRAVMLHVDETNNAFLSGPLELSPMSRSSSASASRFSLRAIPLFSPYRPAVAASSARPRRPRLQAPHLGRSRPRLGHHGRRRHRRPRRRKNARVTTTPGGIWPSRRAPAAASRFRASSSPTIPTTSRSTASPSRTRPTSTSSYNHGDGFTVWGVKIDTPQRLARNTDGIDPGDGAKEHDHHAQLHSHGRRQRGHQGRTRRRDQHDHQPRPLLLGPWHVHRQRNQRRRQQDPRLRPLARRPRQRHPHQVQRLARRPHRRTWSTTTCASAIRPTPSRSTRRIQPTARFRATRRPPCATLRCTTCASPAAARSPSTATTQTHRIAATLNGVQITDECDNTPTN